MCVLLTTCYQVFNAPHAFCAVVQYIVRSTHYLIPVFNALPAFYAVVQYIARSTHYLIPVFNAPHAFYAVVQLSTWLPNPLLLAELRDQQLASEVVSSRVVGGKLYNVAVGSNLSRSREYFVREELGVSS